MNIFSKLTRKFQNFIGFEKFNPLNNFDFGDENSDDIKSINNIDLFKDAIEENEELKEVIWVALYHCLNPMKRIMNF